MKIKPLIKYRSTNKAARYIVVDPSMRTWMVPVIFEPTTVNPVFSVWGAGPVRRFDDIQMSLAYAVAMLERDIIRRSFLSPMAQTTAD